MESNSSNDSSQQERRVGPTVSKDKWMNHALAKMARGYRLIVGTTRRTANFYLPGKGYEMCAYHVARQLIRNGAIVKTADHPLGEVYTLLMAPATVNTKPAPRAAAVQDPFDALLDQLDTTLDDNAGASAE